MHLELTTMWADWLAGIGPAAGFGVNEFLPNVPRLAIDADPLPNMALFATPYTDAKCLAWKEPREYPATYVLPDGPIVKEGEAHTAIRVVPSVAVNARILVSKADEEVAARYAEYYLRAVERSTTAWLESSGVNRTRNGIQVVACNRFVSGPWNEAVGSAKARSILALDLEVRDDSPRDN